MKLKQASKGIPERVSLQKNTRKASQNVFYVDITISQSLQGFKASLEQFHKWNIVFSDQICIE